MKRSKPAAPPVHPLDALVPVVAPVAARRGRARRTGQQADVCLPLAPGRAAALGDRALDCVVDYVGADRAGVILSSAAFLEELTAVLASCGVDRRDVYRELDHRRQLGDLLLKLSRQDAEALPMKGGRRRTWRAATTKLP